MKVERQTWHKKCGYVVYVDEDGLIRKCFKSGDRSAQMGTLRIPCSLDAFKMRVRTGKPLDLLSVNEDYSDERR